jgi:hypothetical protein
MNQQIKDELDGILEREGTLKPESVVAFARNPETALHSQFEWDDSQAANRWRLEQARNLIRVAVTVLEDEHQTETRAYVSLKPDRHSGMGYRSTITVLENRDFRKQLLKDALFEFRIFRRKYQEVKELERVFQAMAEVESQTNVHSDETETVEVHAANG